LRVQVRDRIASAGAGILFGNIFPAVSAGVTVLSTAASLQVRKDFAATVAREEYDAQGHIPPIPQWAPHNRISPAIPAYQ